MGSLLGINEFPKPDVRMITDIKWVLANSVNCRGEVFELNVHQCHVVPRTAVQRCTIRGCQLYYVDSVRGKGRRNSRGCLLPHILPLLDSSGLQAFQG